MRSSVREMSEHKAAKELHAGTLVSGHDETSQLCAMCTLVFQKYFVQMKEWQRAGRDVEDLRLQHHNTLADVLEAAESCRLCAYIAAKLQDQFHAELRQTWVKNAATSAK